MTTIQIAKILEAHSINYTIECGKILADDSYTLDGQLYTEQTDLTGISKQKLFDWLGY
jgi:hypothetical protein